MARSQNQKLKILYLQKLLLENTDEQHPLTMDEIKTYLEAKGILAERKSLYDDMEALKLYGLDICYSRKDPKGYYIASRDFELPELKLLVDSVQSSKFITEKKSLELIKKLGKLCSLNEAKLIKRQVYVKNRNKSLNETIYYNVDHIQNAIAQNRKITFLYFQYDVDKKKHYRRNGQLYCVSPFALTWEDENYYLIAFDSGKQTIKHYRVDKMEKMEVTDTEREGHDAFNKIDMAAYTRQVFSMFAGEEQYVTMEFSNDLIGVVLDTFGHEVSVTKLPGDKFRTRVFVAVSQQFYAWVFGLKGKAIITEPPEVVQEYREHLACVDEAQENMVVCLQ